jgi:hypothetical protein
MGRFYTTLELREVDPGGLFRNPRYNLISPLIYRSSNIGLIIVEPEFNTDLDSTPRVPIFYRLLGNRGKAPAVLHDKLYTPPHESIPGITVTRAMADKVLRGATYENLRISNPETILDNVANILCLLIAWGIWAGVRLGGASHWK